MIYGNTDGVKDVILELLDRIYEIRSQKYEVCNREILEILKTVTERIDREISVAIDRRGNVIEVTIGDSVSVELPVADVRERKLSGIRIIHTHPNGISRLSALDLSALLKMRLDCMAAMSVNTQIPRITLGFPTISEGVLAAEITRDLTWEEALAFDIQDKVRNNEELLSDSEVVQDDSEKAVLVGIESNDSLDELKELALAAGIPVSQVVLQYREQPEAQYYLGSGKLDELSDICQITGSNVIIADDELTGTQLKNMEDITGVKVIDRTTLILEIFARRAKSREAKLQVELAQLKYRMTHLIGLGLVLSRTGGGIGTRGPGETQLETDRRRIRNRHHDLTEELKSIRRIRATQRENRFRQELPQVSLVGYTNAGKSTLRNALAERSARDDVKKEGVFEADMLFATLDTTTRAIELPDKRVVTMTDTVGFIRKLPHDLVEAFKSTLEEVIYADVLIHVVDASNPDAAGQAEVVEEVLAELGAVNKPMIIALNKCDLGVSSATDKIRGFYGEEVPTIETSALTGHNLDKLLLAIQNTLPQVYRTFELSIPYDQQKLVNLIHEEGNVLEEEFGETGTRLKAQLSRALAGKLKDYIVDGD